MNEKIIPFSYRTLADKRRAFPLFFSLLFISAVLVVLYTTAQKYAGVIGMIAVGTLTASVMIYIRYITSDYTYSVGKGEENTAYLMFIKLVGKRQSMMACIPLYAIYSIQKFTKDEFKHQKKDLKAKRYNFAPTFSPDEVYLIKAKSRSEAFEIVIEGTDELSARLLEYAAYAKEDFEREEEEE